MRITVTMQDHLIDDLVKFTNASTKTQAVNKALNEWIRFKKLQKIKDLRGKLTIEHDLKSLRDLEIDEIKEING